MIPKSITLRHFKCFTEPFHYTFPSEPGLFLIQGRNEVQSALEGNGCGKSTLFCDAITWCLFGKTPRLLKAGDVLNWESMTSASVQFTFDLNGEEYSVLRTQSPNSLCLDTVGERKVITQDQLNDLIKLDFDSFTSSVVFSQFGSMFLDLSPTDKSTLLSNILDLSVWDQATEKAKKSLTQLDATVLVVKERIAHAKGQLVAWSSHDYTQKIVEWDTQQSEKRQQLEESLATHTAKVAVLKKKGIKIEEKLAVSDQNYKELATIQDELLQQVAEIEKVRTKLLEAEKKFHFEIKNHGNELEKFESVVDICPYCKQKVAKSHLKSEISHLQDKIQAALDQVATIRGQTMAENEKISRLKDDLTEVAQAKAELNTKNSAFLEEKQKLKLEMSKILGSVSQLNKELEALQLSKNPYVAEQKKQQESVNILQNKIQLDQQELEKLDKEVFATGFWTKAFKDVRLLLISDVLTQLELEVNNKLFQLGLQDWKIMFAVEGLTKGGKIKKGFTVTISTPQNLEPVPWNAWSGGETQRLRLAGALGMADLIVSKSGSYPEFEVFDEPSQYLSTAGIEALLSILKDRAKTTGKKIFLIDHRHLQAESFDGVFTVVKTVDGIGIE